MVCSPVNPVSRADVSAISAVLRAAVSSSIFWVNVSRRLASCVSRAAVSAPSAFARAVASLLMAAVTSDVFAYIFGIAATVC